VLRAVVRRGGGVEGCKGVGVEGYRGAVASDRGGEGSSTCDEDGVDERGWQPSPPARGAATNPSRGEQREGRERRGRGELRARGRGQWEKKKEAN